jgi:CDP-glycerol glycerophosphotransferase (TagB/SpsB family)
MASNVFVTGQPRYDVVHEGSKDGDILFFFTWREGMQNMTNKELMASTYMKIIIETIKSPKIIDLLNQFDKKLYVKFHHMLPAVQLGFLNERVVLVDKTVNFTQIIKDCSALITDYSSVCWDYIYNNRPVIFYPFDFEEYSSSPGLYIDLVEDNTMNTVRSRGELEKQLEFILSNDATNSDNSSVSSKYFAHQDLNNCSRIYTQIQQLLNRN